MEKAPILYEVESLRVAYGSTTPDQWLAFNAGLVPFDQSGTWRKFTSVESGIQNHGGWLGEKNLSSLRE